MAPSLESSQEGDSSAWARFCEGTVLFGVSHRRNDLVKPLMGLLLGGGTTCLGISPCSGLGTACGASKKILEEQFAGRSRPTTDTVVLAKMVLRHDETAGQYREERLHDHFVGLSPACDRGQTAEVRHSEIEGACSEAKPRPRALSRRCGGQ